MCKNHNNIGLKLANDVIVPSEHKIKDYVYKKTVYLLILKQLLNWKSIKLIKTNFS